MAPSVQSNVFIRDLVVAIYCSGLGSLGSRDGRAQTWVYLIFNLFDSAVARTLGDVGKPVCHLYAGLFAGFFTQLVNKQLSCIELQCYSMGETYCKFLLGNKDRIDAAAFWQNEGATARDIQRKLQDGVKLK